MKILSLKIERNNKVENLNFSRKKIPEETAERFLIPEGLGKPTINEVVKNSPADKAGILAGDVFLKLNDTTVFTSSQVTEIIKNNKEKPVEVLLKEIMTL